MVALLLAMGVAVAARNLVPFQLTISDQSPLVEFSTTGTVAWNSSFSRSAWTTHTDGQAGMGASWHWINTTAWDSYARPNFSIGVSASDIIVNGDVNGSPPNDTAIDAVVTEYSGVQTGGAGPTGGTNTSGVPASQGVKLSPGQLARVSGLDVNKPLSVQFTITEAVPSVYNVRGFVVTTALWSDAETFDKVPQSTAWFVVDGKPNSQFKVDESVWTVNTSTIYDDYTRRNVSELFCPRGDQNANVTIHVPLRTSFVVLNGTVGPDRSGPSYHWTPVPPGWRPSDMQSGGARSPWVSGQLLHAQRLDPDVNYVLDVTQSTLGNVHLDTVTFYSANHTGSPAKSDVGPIVGGVVGGVCGALVLTLLCFYWCFWRPRKHREREGEATQNTDGSGFDPFSPSQNDDDEGQEPLMQETDAGRVVLPPQYTPAGSTSTTNTTGLTGPTDPTGPTARRQQATAGLQISTSLPDKPHHPALTRSGPSSVTSVLTPLAPWKEPYINGAYTQLSTPASTVPPTPIARVRPGPVAPYVSPIDSPVSRPERPGRM